MSRKEFFKLFAKVFAAEIICLLLFIMIIPNLIGYSRSPRQAANSEAKLVFTNTATYAKKLEVSHDIKLADGVYYGVIQNKSHYENDERKYDIGYEDVGYTGTPDDLQTALSQLMGADRHGYYYVMIKNGIPAHAFWSNNVHMLEYVQTFTNMLDAGDIPDRCEGSYYKESLLGFYGTVNYDDQPLILGGYPYAICEKGSITKIDHEPQTVIYKNEYADDLFKKKKIVLIIIHATMIILAAASPLILTLIVIGIKVLKEKRKRKQK